MLRILLVPLFALIACSIGARAMADDAVKSATLPPLIERFTARGEQPPSEVPDFQKHVSPLLGRLGCNGRACHGSFQGQGGFQLSLFGYDFDADYEALLNEESPRVDLEDKLESLILTKPVDDDMHEGGMRYEKDGWEYWVLRNWIEADAPYKAKQVQKLERLEVRPRELTFSESGQKQQLTAVAYWSDGSAEDVTCLCRFTSNDAAIADIDENGVVTSGEPGDTHVVVSYDSAVVPILALRPLSDQVGDAYPDIATHTEIDRFVGAKLRKLGIVPSEICSDDEFLRRASLDVTGTLPSAEEVLQFVSDSAPDKRERKIEEMLGRASYVAQWTTFLCDMTGNNEDQLRNFMPQTVRPENQWYQWIYKRVAENVPYDEIVEGIVTATSRLPDESYADYCAEMSDICRDPSGEEFAERPGLVHYWARNNFRTAEERAIGFAYSFLGVRIQCAQCHKHPFDQWSKADFDNFERLFGGVQANQNTRGPDAKADFAKMVSALGIDEKLKGNQLRRELANRLKEGESVPLPELVVSKPRPPRNKGKGGKGKAKPQIPKAKLLGGDWVAMDRSDIRGELMSWLRSEDNPYFAKAIVNRVWAQYFGVGIVNPPDDLNLANAPSNAPLLDYLADGFRAHQFDMKWLHKEILNSDAYQRSWKPNETNRLDKHNFSRALLRRLPAEATYDALRMALANDKVSEDARELSLPRAITKTGASARANRQDDQTYALTVFGRSIRESNCDCDRSNEPSLLQTVFLANDTAVQKWLTDPKTSWASQVSRKFKWATESDSAGAKQETRRQEFIERATQQIAAVDKRLQDAIASGNKNTIRSRRQQRQVALDRIKAAARKAGATDAEIKVLLAGKALQNEESESQAENGQISQQQAQWVAENAYLRTLNRKPNSSELNTSVAFLLEGDQPKLAVEGLLWSLVNTKEFILNH